MSAPPTYQASNNSPQIFEAINKKIFENLKSVLDRIDNIEENGISYEHNIYIRQIMKAFDRNYVYDGFVEDYNYVLQKLTAKITDYNNYALRSINEALEPK